MTFDCLQSIQENVDEVYKSTCQTLGYEPARMEFWCPEDTVKQFLRKKLKQHHVKNIKGTFMLSHLLNRFHCNRLFMYRPSETSPFNYALYMQHIDGRKTHWCILFFRQKGDKEYDMFVCSQFYLTHTLFPLTYMKQEHILPVSGYRFRAYDLCMCTGFGNSPLTLSFSTSDMYELYDAVKDSPVFQIKSRVAIRKGL